MSTSRAQAADPRPPGWPQTPRRSHRTGVGWVPAAVGRTPTSQAPHLPVSWEAGRRLWRELLSELEPPSHFLSRRLGGSPSCSLPHRNQPTSTTKPKTKPIFPMHGGLNRSQASCAQIWLNSGLESSESHLRRGARWWPGPRSGSFPSLPLRGPLSTPLCAFSFLVCNAWVRTQHHGGVDGRANCVKIVRGPTRSAQHRAWNTASFRQMCIMIIKVPLALCEQTRRRPPLPDTKVCCPERPAPTKTFCSTRERCPGP